MPGTRPARRRLEVSLAVPLGQSCKLAYLLGSGTAPQRKRCTQSYRRLASRSHSHIECMRSCPSLLYLPGSQLKHRDSLFAPLTGPVLPDTTSHTRFIAAFRTIDNSIFTTRAEVQEEAPAMVPAARLAVLAIRGMIGALILKILARIQALHTDFRTVRIGARLTKLTLTGAKAQRKFSRIAVLTDAQSHHARVLTQRADSALYLCAMADILACFALSTHREPRCWAVSAWGT